MIDLKDQKLNPGAVSILSLLLLPVAITCRLGARMWSSVMGALMLTAAAGRSAAGTVMTIVGNGGRLIESTSSPLWMRTLGFSPFGSLGFATLEEKDRLATKQALSVAVLCVGLILYWVLIARSDISSNSDIFIVWFVFGTISCLLAWLYVLPGVPIVLIAVFIAVEYLVCACLDYVREGWNEAQEKLTRAFKKG